MATKVEAGDTVNAADTSSVQKAKTAAAREFVDAATLLSERGYRMGPKLGKVGCDNNRKGTNPFLRRCGCGRGTKLLKLVGMSTRRQDMLIREAIGN